MQAGNVLGHRGQQGVPFRSGQFRRFLQGFDLPFAWELVELARYVAYQQASANAFRPGFFVENDFRIVGESETGCHAESFIVGRWDRFLRTSRVESASSEFATLAVLASLHCCGCLFECGSDGRESGHFRVGQPHGQLCHPDRSGWEPKIPVLIGSVIVPGSAEQIGLHAHYSQCAESGQRLGATSVESELLKQAAAIENKTGIQKSTLLTPNSRDQANKLSQGSSLPECGTCGESGDPGSGRGRLGTPVRRR